MKRRLKTFRRKVYGNADRITSVLAIIGLGATVGLAIEETRKGIDILDTAYDEIASIKHEVAEKGWSEEEETRAIREVQKETVKQLVVNYIPTIVGMVTTSACIIGSNKISRDRNAVLSGGLNAANLAFQEYRDHVRKAIGEKKEVEIHDDIQKKHIESSAVPFESRILNSGDGDTLCYIELEPGIRDAGIYFYSSYEAVRAAVNDANGEGLETGYVSLADFLYFLIKKNVTYSGITMSGWRIQSRSDFIKIRTTSFVHESGKPVLAISFWEQPYYGFDRFG